ncbi:hypothetical protein PDIDSM_6637 [Penicillium digitatum]|nr:hypothetical protein PDIDSM_6637 [Penicillium digitatum]
MRAQIRFLNHKQPIHTSVEHNSNRRESPIHSLPSFTLLLQAVISPGNQSRRLPQPQTQRLLQRARICLSQMLNERLGAPAAAILWFHSDLCALSSPRLENPGLSYLDVGAQGGAALKAPVAEVHVLVFRAGGKYRILSSVFAGILVAARRIIMAPMKAQCALLMHK